MWLGMWMTSCLEAMGLDSWVIWKKAVSWRLNLDGESWDSNLGEASSVVLLQDVRAFVGSVSWELTLDEQSA